ncbi:TetR/AcrR family transcriptional regulator [Streptomyces sp. NPDC058378]|uniref:TetR/AcrR family transcriptional regulator n=1 Tax=unclassified Streptomyces TaxID=2593676 RepID=UPI0036477894
MDPRARRTRNKLREAVTDLAAERAIGEITVAEVARRAGVTRNTVYNHAPTPTALLCLFLGEEVDNLSDAFLDEVERTSAVDIRAALHSVIEALLRHVAEYATIYEPAFAGATAPIMSDLLAQQCAHGMHVYITRHPELMPEYENLADNPDALALAAEIHVAFVSRGAVGAISAWLRSPPPHSVEAGVVALLNSLPGWWYGRPGQVGEREPSASGAA